MCMCICTSAYTHACACARACPMRHHVLLGGKCSHLFSPLSFPSILFSALCVVFANPSPAHPLPSSSFPLFVGDLPHPRRMTLVPGPWDPGHSSWMYVFLSVDLLVCLSLCFSFSLSPSSLLRRHCGPRWRRSCAFIVQKWAGHAPTCWGILQHSHCV